MQRETMTVRAGQREANVPVTRVHTLVVGSGAAGLNAANQLKAMGVEDVLVVTEGLQMGTSINTGSDKQTYYKLAMCGDDADSPRAMRPPAAACHPPASSRPGADLLSWHSARRRRLNNHS
mgnify:CR=1 FL=1